MSNTIIELRHSYVTGNVPSSLANGEIAINTYDGKLFYRGGVSNTIQTIERFQGPAGLNQEVQFNDSGVLGADSGLTYNKTTDVLTVVGGAIVGGVNVTPQIQLAFTQANTPSHVANSAASYANSAFSTANSKTFTFEQNTAPSTANSSDFWVNNDTGFMYQNFGNSANPVWAEVGPTGTLANTAPGIVNASQVQIGGKQAVNGPAFRAYIATEQAITSGSQQKVTFGTETFDTNSNFSSSRFTPTIEGYYQLNATVRIEGNSGTGECMITIWKNGSEYARGTNEQGTEQGANWYSMQVSDIAYANGSSDYFEIYIQQTSGGNRNTTAGTNISYFSGLMVRGA